MLHPEIDATVHEALDHLARAILAVDNDTASEQWANKARHLLADKLNPAELVEALIDALAAEAVERADVLLHDVTMVDGAA